MIFNHFFVTLLPICRGPLCIEIFIYMELQVIQSKIYEIRGLQVMLDFDLAELYEVETRVLN